MGVWYAVSSLAVVLVKIIAPGGGSRDLVMSAVVDMTFAQLSAAALSATVVLAMGTRSGTAAGAGMGDDVRYGTKHVRMLAAAAMLNVLGTASANWCTVAVGASTSQVVKLLEPAVTVLLARLVLGAQTSASVWGAIGITSAGVYISTAASLTSLISSAARSPLWLMSLLVTVTSFPGSNVCSKRLPTAGVRLTRDLTALGALALLPMQAALFMSRAFKLPAVATAMPALFVAMAFSQGAYRILSFQVLEQTTPVMHSQLRMGKRGAALIATWFLFKDINPSVSTLGGLVLLAAGLGWYVALETAKGRRKALAPLETEGGAREAVSSAKDKATFLPTISEPGSTQLPASAFIGNHVTALGILAAVNLGLVVLCLSYIRSANDIVTPMVSNAQLDAMVSNARLDAQLAVLEARAEAVGGLKIAFVHRHTPTNIGDWVASPRSYFGAFGDEQDVYDLGWPGCHDQRVILSKVMNSAEPYDAVIVGGGGLLGCSNIWDGTLARLARHPVSIMWAAGINYVLRDATATISSPPWLGSYKLHALRDRGPINGTSQLDDPTCMSPLFDKYGAEAEGRTRAKLKVSVAESVAEPICVVLHRGLIDRTELALC